MNKLSDKVALITGAASGIGQACAELFAREGAKVVVADIQENTGREVAKAIGGDFVQVDVSDPASVEEMVNTVLNRHGRLDILFNNAGIDGEQADTANSSVENWRKVLSVNLDGVFYGMKYGIAAMLKQGGGVVLNTSSAAGLSVFPNLPPYVASKAAIIHLSKAAAIEYATKNIRVNSLCPTIVHTPMFDQYLSAMPDPEAVRQMFNQINPMPGMATLDDIAAAALFLVSDDARFITGIALPVDGGFTAK